MGNPLAPIDVRLELESAPPNEIIAKLTFRNVGTESVKLWQRIAFRDGRMNAERFIVKADGEPLEYQGKAVKAGIPKIDEFISLEPGQNIESLVSLNKGYDFPVQGRLEVYYEALNPSLDGETLTPLRSNTASIILSR
jgi:hypothetical protein